MPSYDEIRARHILDQLALVRRNLEKRGFAAVIKETREEILDFVGSLIPRDVSVGVGGSVTVRELGLPAMLAERGNTVYDHWREGLSGEEAFETRRRQLTADYFLTGTNALTEDGKLVNIDGTGNRVAAMSFGPGHVVVIAGAGKIARNLDEALWRVKNVASPRNCRRLGLKTPCSVSGYCHDCGPDSSVCRITTILEYKPMNTAYTIILTPLMLGL